MINFPSNESRPLGGSERRAVLRCEHLLRALLREAEYAAAANDPPSSDGRVLEVVIDGRHYILLSKPTSNQRAGVALLSPREQEIVRSIAQGMTIKAIAVQLDLKPSTVCTYVRRVYAKLGINSRAELVVEWLRLQDQSTEQ